MANDCAHSRGGGKELKRIGPGRPWFATGGRFASRLRHAPGRDDAEQNVVTLRRHPTTSDTSPNRSDPIELPLGVEIQVPRLEREATRRPKPQRKRPRPASIRHWKQPLLAERTWMNETSGFSKIAEAADTRSCVGTIAPVP